MTVSAAGRVVVAVAGWVVVVVGRVVVAVGPVVGVVGRVVVVVGRVVVVVVDDSFGGGAVVVADAFGVVVAVFNEAAPVVLTVSAALVVRVASGPLPADATVVDVCDPPHPDRAASATSAVTRTLFTLVPSARARPGLSPGCPGH